MSELSNRDLMVQLKNAEAQTDDEGLEYLIETARGRIAKLEAENADLKARLQTWEPKPLPPKGERGFETPTKKGKRK